VTDRQTLIALLISAGLPFERQAGPAASIIVPIAGQAVIFKFDLAGYLRVMEIGRLR